MKENVILHISQKIQETFKHKLQKITIYMGMILKVRGPFVQTLCIEKDSYMDAFNV